MNTFHNFSTCIYTTQGKVVCNKAKDATKPSLPFLLESFVNTNPNQQDNDCSLMNKKFNEVAVNFNCSSQIDNNPPNCSFKFDCKEKH